MEQKEKKNKFTTKNVIITLSVLLILTISSIGLYVYLQLNKIGGVDLDKSDEALGIKTNVQENDMPLNIVIFGLDQMAIDDIGRSDVIMIVSIDKKNHTIKLSSIMRDTYVNIPGRGMDKINHAYAFGGPQLAINTINSNFNMDIKDFATVSFLSMEHIIDDLGGVDINVSQEELSRIEGLENAGMQHLNGHEAVDYMQIRYVGNGDYQRTERQRTVMTQIINKVQALGPNKMPSLVSKLLPYTTTSISKIDLLRIGADVFASNITTIKQMRLPLDSTCEGSTINGIYYLVADLPANTTALHDFIYDDNKYTGSN